MGNAPRMCACFDNWQDAAFARSQAGIRADGARATNRALVVHPILTNSIPDIRCAQAKVAYSRLRKANSPQNREITHPTYLV